MLDIRGASYIDAFTQLRDATNLLTRNEELLVFVDAHEQEKCMIIKGFVEILLECKATIKETSGHYIIYVIHENSRHKKICITTDCVTEH